MRGVLEDRGDGQDFIQATDDEIKIAIVLFTLWACFIILWLPVRYMVQSCGLLCPRKSEEQEEELHVQSEGLHIRLSGQIRATLMQSFRESGVSNGLPNSVGLLGWLFFYTGTKFLNINPDYYVPPLFDQKAERLATFPSLFLIAIFCLKIVLSIVDWAARRFYSYLDAVDDSIDSSNVDIAFIVQQCGRFVACTIFFLLMLGFVINDVSGLLTSLTLGASAIVAFGISEEMGNLYGLAMIVFDQPFKMGDHVNVAGVEGFISQVGLASFVTEGFDGSKTWLANKTVMNSPVKNLSVKKMTQSKIAFTLSYDTSSQSFAVFKELRLKLMTWLRAVKVGDEEELQLGSFISVMVDLTKEGVSYNVLYSYPKGEILATDDPDWNFYIEAEAFRTEVIVWILDAVKNLGLKFATFPVSVKTDTVYKDEMEVLLQSSKTSM